MMNASSISRTRELISAMILSAVAPIFSRSANDLNGVKMTPAFEAAVNAAVDGEGVIRILSYKIDRQIRDGSLVILLPDDELPPVPVWASEAIDLITSLVPAADLVGALAAQAEEALARASGAGRPAGR